MSENNGNGIGIKEFEANDAIERSVIAQPPRTTGGPPSFGQTYWFVNSYADEIAPWGAQHVSRDVQLRNFILQENIFAAALGIICSRNSGFSWKIDGPPRTASKVQELLEASDQGRGWHDLIVKTSIDLYTQDNGAFMEIVREVDNERAPAIGLNHLDAARCWHTGIQEAPVVYQDIYGKFHLLKWYNVIEFAEMPASIEYIGYYGLQYCSLSRLLRRMQTIKNIDIYNNEKTGGRDSKKIILAKGVTTQQLTDAINQANARADSAGLMRYAPAVVLGTLDPRADVGHDTIDLVGMPDGYDEDKSLGHYINLIAMAFETDYQEFAPLPGQRLGTGAQSEVLHMKARGKGPGTFMRMITRAINYRVVPQNVRFFFDEQDLEGEKIQAEVKAIRAQTRAVRIASGEITPQVARQLANDDGDLSEDMIDLMGEQDVTPDITVQDDDPASTTQRVIPPGTPAPDVAPGSQTAGQPSGKPSVRPPTPLRGRTGPVNASSQKDFSPEGIKESGEKLLEFLQAL